ncbi:heterokaryon incompatibility protein-domain-containing protein [Suillus paluster]|uniref:heterokaryon incompatibility protein-domain-containing protein n=1 Tax=Suillus paluster TaxID=48578 RepID=UPI001B85F93D|nr:heterokaryon incompatibility protein-domain-containing protein [Suillus paluster]KAG1731240.1 heterokaryon incompatibility protein-domain-containing protein [Suillus paluster]
MRQTEKERLHDLDNYVMNYIPIHLVRLSDMALVSREDVREHFKARFLQSDGPPSETVKYATLSHRWGQGEPTYATFEEMKKSARKTPGLEKLMNFCEKAKECGAEFAWSDTCCIDKSSSAELDESIRSMFKWYRNSHVCIVYLAQSETIEDVLHDEWMERGWTLQELLAPIRIKFFNKRWIAITRNNNDKDHSKMMDTLNRATGIPHGDLRRFNNISPSNVDKRMTWAAKRKTTRVEDVAYSLMGIFRVSMQIAYGEGGDSAFGRLIEAIMQAGDPSVLNWKGESASYCNYSRAIPQSPRCFVGDGLLSYRGQLEMTMTSLGLRVPLVMLPLNFHSFYLSGDKEILKFECSLCPALKINIKSPYNPGYGHTFKEPGRHYAVGIVNYSLIGDGSREVLKISGKSAGFILMKSVDDTPPDPPSRPASCVGLRFVSPPQRELCPWEAIEGGLVEVKFPKINSNDIFYIGREYLETVYI